MPIAEFSTTTFITIKTNALVLVILGWIGFTKRDIEDEIKNVLTAVSYTSRERLFSMIKKILIYKKENVII